MELKYKLHVARLVPVPDPNNPGGEPLWIKAVHVTSSAADSSFYSFRGAGPPPEPAKKK